MPVRSLTSSVFKWPDAQMVSSALRRWAAEVIQQHPEILRIGYFGSYARGDWGVGSDLDLIIVVEDSSRHFIRRAAEWDVTELPVPTDCLVYTAAEWCSLSRPAGFAQTVDKEIVWVYVQDQQ